VQWQTRAHVRNGAKTVFDEGGENKAKEQKETLQIKKTKDQNNDRGRRRREKDKKKEKGKGKDKGTDKARIKTWTKARQKTQA
jgi:hypothetical protein